MRDNQYLQYINALYLANSFPVLNKEKVRTTIKQYGTNFTIEQYETVDHSIRSVLKNLDESIENFKNLAEQDYKDSKVIYNSLLKKKESFLSLLADDKERATKANKKAIVKTAEIMNSTKAGKRISEGGKIDSTGSVIPGGRFDLKKCNFSNWNNLIAISMTETEILVGLKADGTVLSMRKDGRSIGSASNWNHIVDIAAGYNHLVGLRANGTVIAIGDNHDGQCKVSEWRDIVAISAGFNHTVGLKKDGTVVATGSNYYGQCDVSEWKDIVAISAGHSHTLGLKSNRKVVSTVITRGRNDDGQTKVSTWEDIISISANLNASFGIKSDGTVVATRYTSNYAKELFATDYVSELYDIVAINKESFIRKDGKIVDKHFVSSKNVFDDYESYCEEVTDRVNEKEAQLIEKIRNNNNDILELQNAYDIATGLFSGLKKKKIEENIEAKKKEIERLQNEIDVLTFGRK